MTGCLHSYEALHAGVAAYQEIDFPMNARAAYDDFMLKEAHGEDTLSAFIKAVQESGVGLVTIGTANWSVGVVL